MRGLSVLWLYSVSEIDSVPFIVHEQYLICIGPERNALLWYLNNGIFSQPPCCCLLYIYCICLEVWNIAADSINTRIVAIKSEYEDELVKTPWHRSKFSWNGPLKWPKFAPERAKNPAVIRHPVLSAPSQMCWWPCAWWHVNSVLTSGFWERLGGVGQLGLFMQKQHH